MSRRRPRYAWEKLSDEELLDLRFKDLLLKIPGSPVEERIERLYDELERKGLSFRPHVWFSSEWFSPDGVPGVAVPFYLGAPRLARLERKMMLEVEGGNEAACMRLLRHETGHALDSAYRLHATRAWREAFGRWSEPYRMEYVPKPYSKRFVMHLDMWYAQSHPAEDWAETFAVWLRPRSDWRRRYARWPALKKLEAVDAMMQAIRDQPPRVRSREQTERLSSLGTTLRAHYQAKQERYAADPPELFDPQLRRLFPDPPESAPASRGTSAARFLRRHRDHLRRAVARWTGQYRYTIDAVLADMIDRAVELDLRLRRDEAEALADATVVLTIQTMNHLHRGGFSLAR